MNVFEKSLALIDKYLTETNPDIIQDELSRYDSMKFDDGVPFNEYLENFDKHFSFEEFNLKSENNISSLFPEKKATEKIDENQNKNYAVNFNVALSRENKSFQLSLKASAIFATQKPIDDEFKESGFIKINSPAIAFPYIRSFISTLTTNAGINPVVLPAYNFSNPDNNK